MSSSVIGALVAMEPSEIMQTPPPSYSKTPVRNESPCEFDLQIDLEMHQIPNGSNKGLDEVPKHASPRTSSEVDLDSQPVNQIQTMWNLYMNRFRVLATCLAAFRNGMNDSALGALIASIERYHF